MGNYAQDVLFIVSVMMSFLISTIHYKIVNTETFAGCEQTLPNETPLRGTFMFQNNCHTF